MPDLNDLSERELEILNLVAKGKSNKDISQELIISPNTVKVHLRNIFPKIGVTTRTEATLFAIQNGLIDVTGVSSSNAEVFNAPTLQDDTLTQTLQGESTTIKQPVMAYRNFLLVVLGVAILTTIVLIYIGTRNETPTLAINTVVTPTVPVNELRWKLLQSMPTPRGGLAVEVFDHQIYAIGGENENGVLAVTERFDPKTGAWIQLAPKITAVTDIGAAVVGGKIYIPGGRLASGQATDVLEIFDPRLGIWEQGSSLPSPISGYAIATFEGSIFVFGGWNGLKYVNDVYEYDPSRDKWETRTPMPTARGFAGAATSGGIIYVLGGFDGQKALTTNEMYDPPLDNGNDTPWSSASPLETPRYSMGVASIADHLHLFGGEGEVQAENAHLEFIPANDEWRFQPTIIPMPWADMGLIAYDTHLYAIGGLVEGETSAQTVSFQALFTILIPVVK